MGALLISGGAILLFAYNWDMLSTWQRVAVAFVPLLIGAVCGIYTIVKERDRRWREFSAVFTAAGFTVLTALISQIYHSGGTLLDFTRLVLAVSLPLVYIFKSQALTAVYCLGLFTFLGYRSEQLNLAWAYLAAILPFICCYLFFSKQRGPRTTAMRYIALIPLVFLILLDERWYSITIHFAAASMLYVAGLYYHDEGERGWKNPWLALGWLYLTALLVFASTTRYAWQGVYEYARGPNHFSILWPVFFAAGACAALRKATPLKILVMLSPLLPLSAEALGIGSSTMVFAANGYLLLIACAALARGVRGRGLLEINAGMLQLTLLVWIRFYDERIGIMTRAVAFMIVGMAFIMANVYLGRKFRKDNAAEVRAEVSGDEK